MAQRDRTAKNSADTSEAADRRAEERRQTQDRRDTAERRARSGTARKSKDRRVRDRRRKGPEAERRKVQRRINEYVLEPDVLEFINAVNEFKSVNQKPFPTWSEIFQIFVGLGYRKTDG